MYRFENEGGRAAGAGADPEVCPGPEPERGVGAPVLGRVGRPAPQVETVERFARQLPVPQYLHTTEPKSQKMVTEAGYQVDPVGGVGRLDVAGQLRPAALHCRHVADGN